jgi:hypothetical protein
MSSLVFALLALVRVYVYYVGWKETGILVWVCIVSGSVASRGKLVL